MSKITIALESAVATVIANTLPEGHRPTARQRADTDRAFVQILKLIAPRIRHFIRQYGLAGHWDDAEQACSIGVHRAIQSYDPARAQFTTFVNWQIRGELQGLRFRLMTDQRPSARKVDAATVSLHAIVRGAEGEETSLESMIEDETATAQTEAGAADYLAESAMRSMIDSYIDHLRTTAISQLKRKPRPRPALPGIDPEELARLDQRLLRNRQIVESRIFELPCDDDQLDQAGITKERIRQIAKRAAKTISEITATEPRFELMEHYHRPPAPQRRPGGRAAAKSVEISPALPHVVAPLSVAEEAPLQELVLAGAALAPEPQSGMCH